MSCLFHRFLKQLSGALGLFLAAAVLSGQQVTTLRAEIINGWPAWVRETDESGEVIEENHAGPLVQSAWQYPGPRLAIRPILLERRDEAKKSREIYFLYPFFSRRDYPELTNWNVFGFIRGSTMRYSSGAPLEYFTVFPIYFSRQTGNPATSYRSVFPIVGHVERFLFWQEFTWVAFPLWSKTQKNKETTTQMPWPIFRWRTGPGTRGFGFWPILGHFQRTGRYDHRYALWPLIYNYTDRYYEPKPRVRQGFLPFFAREESWRVRSMTVIWPFFGWTKKIRPNYSEMRYFWPFFVQGRGDFKYVNRWAPIYTHSIYYDREKKWYLWPFVRIRSWQEKGLSISRRQFLYFIYWGEFQYSQKHPAHKPARRVTLWPLYTYWDNAAGHRQLQMFSLLESLMPHSQVVREFWSPLFSIYRREWKPDQSTRLSLLFGLFRHQNNPQSQTHSFTLGPLFQNSFSPEQRTVQLLGGFLGFRRTAEGKKTFKFFWKEF